MTKTEIDTVIVMKNALDELRKAAETMSRCMAANHISPLPSFYDAHNRACYALGCAEALAQQGDCQCADQRDCTGACCVSKQQPVAWYDEEMDEAYTATELDGGNTDGLIPLYAGAAPTAQRCDTARVLEWMRTPNRKAAQFAFTEGPERQAAYWIEIAQGEPSAQQMELGEQKPVAWAFKNEYGITLSEGDCTTLPNGVSTPLYAGSAPAVLEAVEKLEKDAAMLLLVRDNLFKGMGKSMQKLQAESINEVLGLPKYARHQKLEATNGQGN